jgi:uncharacterized protein YmfQ (DUF2313 family)
MNTRDALLECLPPVAYDRAAPNVRAEATSAATVLDYAITLADFLAREQQPDTTAQMLGDWERNYGLPDACIGGVGATEAARRANLMDRVAGRGNLSRSFFIAQALGFGYAGCTITEYGPMTCADPCDGSVNGPEFIGVWRLNVPVSTVVNYATCESPCDTPLASWGNTQLECMVNRRKPAHTVAVFGYAP